MQQKKSYERHYQMAHENKSQKLATAQIFGGCYSYQTIVSQAPQVQQGHFVAHKISAHLSDAEEAEMIAKKSQILSIILVRFTSYKSQVVSETEIL